MFKVDFFVRWLTINFDEEEGALSKGYLTSFASHGGPNKCIFRDVLKMGELSDLAGRAIIELEKYDLNFDVVKMDEVSFA